MSSKELAGVILTLLSAFLISFGTYSFVESWATIQQIQAQGLIGQALNQEAYQSATQDAARFATIASVGIVLSIFAATQFIVAELGDSES